LKIDVQQREDHQVMLTVEVDDELLADAKQRAARHISKHTKIPGFRPGKAPYALVQRVAGDEAILEEAVELLVKDVYPKALDEAGIEPYGPGSLENIKSTTPPTFEFLIPLKADVQLGDYQSIRLPYELGEVSDDEVENVISGLREQQAVIEPVDRPAQEGDLVYIKMSGSRNQPVEGEDSSIVKERSMPVNITKEGDDTSDEWPFPGFSRKLIGLSAGDNVTLEYAYPDDAFYEAFKGIKAEFKVVIEGVKLRTLPELDDDFAQTVGDFPTLEALRTQIRKNLETQKLEMTNEEYDEKVLDKIVELSTIKYPPQMFERETDHVIEHLKERLERQHLDIDLYLKSRQMDMNGLREEAKPVAETRIKRSLVLLEIADQLKINVTPEDLQAETQRTLSDFSRVMPEKDFRKMVSSREGTSDLIGNIMMDMVIDRAKERLREIARGLIAESAETPETPSPEPSSPEQPEETPKTPDEIEAENSQFQEQSSSLE